MDEEDENTGLGMKVIHCQSRCAVEAVNGGGTVGRGKLCRASRVRSCGSAKRCVLGGRQSSLVPARLGCPEGECHTRGQHLGALEC